MNRLVTPTSALVLWAMLAGLALWTPAIGIPVAVVFLQPMDFLIALGLPLALLFGVRMGQVGVLVLGGFAVSILLSWLIAGGLTVVVIWSLVFALPFVALCSAAFSVPRAAEWFLTAFLVGATLSALLFLAQISLGAQQLDFRTNLSFRLPPHYGRGFALFPEVSTFAAHVIVAGAVALCLALHPLTAPRLRRRMVWLLLLIGLVLPFSQSTSVLVIAPALICVALIASLRPSINSLLLALLLALLAGGFISLFLELVYAERLENSSAGRSAAMRLASMLGGLSPLSSGEVFGVGVGENGQVTHRAHQAAKAWGLNFGQLPEGVNSHVITRIFEEGWPALLHMAVAIHLLWRSRTGTCHSPLAAALFTLAIGSLLTAMLVTGYRGIYTNWIWLAATIALARVPKAKPAANPVQGAFA